MPGIVAFCVPVIWAWRAHDTAIAHPAGLALVLAGTCGLLWCVRDFYVAGKGTLAVEVEVASIDFGHDALNAEMAKPEYLDAAGHPIARYEGKLAGFVDGKPKQNAYRQMSDMPAVTPESTAMAKALKSNGFRFCGPTTLHAFMQSVGMVNDHLTTCFRHAECARLGKAQPRPRGSMLRG